MIDNWWRQGMMGGAKAQYDGIKAFSETDFTEDLKSIDVPTLVMHGDDDQIVPIADSAPLSAKLLKKGTLKVYEKFPHGMCTTHADVINADLLAFIKEVTGGCHRGHRRSDIDQNQGDIMKNERTFAGVGGLKIATGSWQFRAGRARSAVMVLIHGFDARSGYMAWPASDSQRGAFACRAGPPGPRQVGRRAILRREVFGVARGCRRLVGLARRKTPACRLRARAQRRRHHSGLVRLRASD